MAYSRVLPDPDPAAASLTICRFSPDSLRKARIPVMVAHGMADSTVSLEQAKANYDAIPGDKEWLPVEGAEHTLPLIVGGEAVQNQVIAFYGQYMKA